MGETIAETRTEADFTDHIARLIQSVDPSAHLVLLCDQLNTHKSE